MIWIPVIVSGNQTVNGPETYEDGSRDRGCEGSKDSEFGEHCYLCFVEKCSLEVDFRVIGEGV